MKSIYIARRVLFANIPMLFVLMATALIFTFIFGRLLGGGPGGSSVYPIAMVKTAESGPVADFQAAIINNERLDVTVVSEAEARELVRERKVVMGLLIDSAFNNNVLSGQGPKLVLLRNEDNNLFFAVRQEVERSLTHVRVAVVAANRLVGVTGSSAWDSAYAEALESWQTPPVRVETAELGVVRDPRKHVDRVGIGMTVMFVMITVITASGAILDERTRGTWQRLLTAPLSRGTVLRGYLLSYFTLGALQFSLLVLASRFIAGIHWGDTLGVTVMTVVFLLCTIALGLVIAGVVRTFQQQQAVSSLVVTATSMLGGLFWPLDIASPLMQTIAKTTPQYWAMEGYEQLLLRGLDWQVLQRPILVLTCFMIVFFIFGISRIRFE